MSAADPVARFCEMFAVLEPHTPMDLARVYAPSVVFDDPFHHVEGRDALQKYFEKLNRGLVRATFAFGDPIREGNRAFLPWSMRLRLKVLKKEITADGCSVLTYDSLILTQRDYFDAGAMAYEHIPLLGGAIRFFKRQM